MCSHPIGSLFTMFILKANRVLSDDGLVLRPWAYTPNVGCSNLNRAAAHQSISVIRQLNVPFL